MSKLTQDLKNVIKNNACEKAGLYTLQDNIQKDRYALAEDLYALRMAPYKDVIQVVEALEKQATLEIPESLRSGGRLVLRSNQQAYNLAGETHRIKYQGETRIVDNTGTTFALPASHTLVKRHNRLQDRTADLAKRFEDVRAEVGAVLSSVNTIPQLLKLWPEAKELLPMQNQPAPTQLPAVQLQHLNGLLGLPTESKPE